MTFREKNSSDVNIREKKSRFDKKELFSVMLRLTAIVAAVVLMLAVVNMFTKDAIDKNSRQKITEALSTLFPDAEYQKLEALPEGVDRTSVLSVYKVVKDGKTVGACVEVYANGFSSDNVQMMVGVSATEYTVTGVEIISSSETPGIGAAVIAKNGEYLKKFKNTSKLAVEDIDTVSGATITSSAVKKAVLLAINTASAALGGAENG